MIILAAAPHQCISAEGLNIGPLSSLDLKLLLWGVLTRSTAGPGNTPVKLLLSDLIYLSEQLEMLLTMSHKVEVFKAATFGLNFWTVGDFIGALQKALVDPAPPVRQY